VAANFRIFSHLNSENLHLKLVGDFDKYSVWELLMALNAYRDYVKKIFIHTSDLSQVDPAARELFSSTLVDFKAGRNSVIRTGDQDIGLS
jgi:ABC-type transporter Mla MlaB component